MGEMITVVYEHGVLRPLAPLPLPENAQVNIQIVGQPAHMAERARVYKALADAGIISPGEPAIQLMSVSDSELDRISRSLAEGGPLSDSIIADREER